MEMPDRMQARMASVDHMTKSDRATTRLILESGNRFVATDSDLTFSAGPSS